MGLFKQALAQSKKLLTATYGGIAGISMNGPFSILNVFCIITTVILSAEITLRNRVVTNVVSNLLAYSRLGSYDTTTNNNRTHTQTYYNVTHIQANYMY